MIKDTTIIFVSVALVLLGGLTAIEPGYGHAYSKPMGKKIDLNSKLSGHNESQYTKELYEKRWWVKRHHSKK